MIIIIVAFVFGIQLFQIIVYFGKVVCVIKISHFCQQLQYFDNLSVAGMSKPLMLYSYLFVLTY